MAPNRQSPTACGRSRPPSIWAALPASSRPSAPADCWPPTRIPAATPGSPSSTRETRNGVVFGWLTHERGSGVLFTRDDDGAVEVDARLDYGRLRIEPTARAERRSSSKRSPSATSTTPGSASKRGPMLVAKHYDVKLPPQPVGLLHVVLAAAWRRVGREASRRARRVRRRAARALRVLRRADRRQVAGRRIDQRPEAQLHRRTIPTARTPTACKAIAAHIAALGLTPGLWYMPFAGTHYDPFFTDRQHWFVKREDGEPYETAWGGTCLDLTHPEVREYVRERRRSRRQRVGLPLPQARRPVDRHGHQAAVRQLGLQGRRHRRRGVSRPRRHQRRSLSQRPAAGARDGRPQDVHPRLQRAAEHAVLRRSDRAGRRDARRAGQRLGVGPAAARAGVRLAALLSARPGVVQRPRPRVRARGDAAEPRAARLLVGRDHGAAQPVERVAARAAAGAARHSAADDAGPRPAAAAGGPVRARPAADLAADRRPRRRAPRRDRAVQLGRRGAARSTKRSSASASTRTPSTRRSTTGRTSAAARSTSGST